MKVSVIMPVYNAGTLLPRCIGSILSQTFSDYELILVDDGSTDGSGELCDEYSKLNEKVVVIHQENQGISAARNRGIEASRGEWLMFCDDDDEVSSDWIDTLLPAAEKNRACLVNCEYAVVKANGERIRKEIPGINGSTYFPKNEYFTFFKHPSYSSVLWTRIFNAEIVKKNRISFDVSLKRGGEDDLFVIDYLKFCEGFLYIPRICYYWINNGGNTSRQYNPEAYLMSEKKYLARKQFIAPQYLQIHNNISFQWFLDCVRNIVENEKSLCSRIRKCEKIFRAEGFGEVLEKIDAKDYHKGTKVLIQLLRARQYGCVFVYFEVSKFYHLLRGNKRKVRAD